MRVDTVTVIIPTYNGEKEIAESLQMLRKQSRRADRVIIVDSSSTDSTIDIIRQFPEVTLYQIPQAEFDHGGTRDFALRQADSEFVIFLTQDAVPCDENYIKKILTPFSDAHVAAVSGRQIPKAEARPFEKIVREVNYPAESMVWDASDKERLGIRAYALSDTNAAYRTEAFYAVGGFDKPVPTNEDMLIAEKFIRSGYKLAYNADAAVYHSHNFTLAQQYMRYYSIGKILKKYADRLQCNENGYGFRFAMSVVNKLLKNGQFAESIAFILDCAARVLGSRKGKHSG